MDAGKTPQTGPSGDLPVPEWIPKKESWFDSFRASLNEVLGPRKIIRFRKRTGAGEPPPFRAPGFSSTVTPRIGSFRQSVREIFLQRESPAAQAGAGGAAPFPAPALSVDFQSWKESFRETVRQIFQPEKLPPLSKEAAKVRVDQDLWATKEEEERTRRTRAISLLVHATVLVMVTMPFFQQWIAAEPPEAIELTDTNLDFGLPQDLRRSKGGGGGGNRSRNEASLGRLPRFDLEKQLAPPTTQINNPDPVLPVEPTLVAPDMARLDLDLLGDPLSNSAFLSDGTGARGGIGSGIGGGIGMGSGPGFGEGFGGGFGGGIYQVGGSVSEPMCVYCPEPEFTAEARKAKYSGTVVLWAVVDVDGRAKRIRVIRAVGLGLDEQAVEVLRTYIFRPAQRYGKAVPVAMNIEVNFTLY